MAYDAKKRPNYLGFDYQRNDPNRLKIGWTVTSVADQNENQILPNTDGTVASQKLSSILGILKIVATALASVAAVIVAAAASGTAIPGWLLSVASAVIAIATPLGIVSTGVKAKNAPSADTLK